MSGIGRPVLAWKDLGIKEVGKHKREQRQNIHARTFQGDCNSEEAQPLKEG